jgi:hypothetical protein
MPGAPTACAFRESSPAGRPSASSRKVLGLVQIDRVRYGEIQSVVIIRQGAESRDDYRLEDAWEPRLGLEVSVPLHRVSLQFRAGAHGLARVASPMKAAMRRKRPPSSAPRAPSPGPAGRPWSREGFVWTRPCAAVRGRPGCLERPSGSEDSSIVRNSRPSAGPSTPARAVLAGASKAGTWGFTSRTGVPSMASRPRTISVPLSTRSMRTVVMPIAFGRCRARCAKMPTRGRSSRSRG